MKTYDQTAFHAEEVGDADETAYTMEEEFDEDWIDTLVQEGDEDAILITEYEGAMSDTLQDDRELAVALNAYSEARRRLSERFRNRGFWPIKPSKGKGKNFSKNKGKFSGGRKSLQDRILNSRCRICGKLGHWKADCPEKARSSASSTLSGPTASISMTEGSSVGVHGTGSSLEDALTLEFMNLPETLVETPLDEAQLQIGYECFLSVGEALKGISNRSRGKIDCVNSQFVVSPRNEGSPQNESAVLTANSAVVMFASHGSFGVVDLGASKTVIGSQNLPELMQSFDPKTRDQLQRCVCKMQFRFGNQGVLSSTQALVVPIGPLKVKIAIVPGNTPFLISNAFLRGIQAIVDTQKQVLRSPILKEEISLVLSPRGLFLMDLNEVIRAAKPPTAGGVIETICHMDQKPEAEVERSQACPGNVHGTVKDLGSVMSGDEGYTDRCNQPISPTSEMNIKHDRSSSQRSSVSVASPVDSRADSHVPCVSTVQDSDSGQARVAQHRSLHVGRAEGDEDRFRQDTSRPNFPTHVGDGARVDSLVCPALSRTHKIESPPGSQVC